MCLWCMCICVCCLCVTCVCCVSVWCVCLCVVCVLCVCVCCMSVCVAVVRGDTCVSEPQGRLSAGHFPKGPGPGSASGRPPAASWPLGPQPPSLLLWRLSGPSSTGLGRQAAGTAVATCRAMSTVAAVPPLWSLPGALGPVGVVGRGPQPARACSGQRSWGQ